ncbi:nicotinate mononucleotide-dependent phosphoribosyltransferase CobT [Halovenus sp. HT40]|uniref:nicotinate mononucleotide-dependent phosphoribosyltransferase CobT n=1 Tax=Halovenus sp. HT40 TaxID=3126691 RepID=UPI00300EE878
MRLLLVGGNTETARIDGISAAGADPELMAHTPAVDLELVEYGRSAGRPVPVSPTGCPTPAVMTRAARELLGLDVLAVDAGLASETAVPTVDLGGGVGADIREPTAVHSAAEIVAAGKRVGRALPDERVLIGETIPGGTTTALGVLSALGERASVSSSLPENPVSLKERVVSEGREASGLAEGAAAGEPIRAVETMGDPVLAAVMGLTIGATESGTDVTLAGGTQLATAGALVRHAGVDAELSLATTSFVADDDSAAIHALADELGLTLSVTDPRFEERDHQALNGYVAGEAKEGVGMGGVLGCCRDTGLPMEQLRPRILEVYENVFPTEERT